MMAVDDPLQTIAVWMPIFVTDVEKLVEINS